jgi:acyl carrier protein
LAHTLELNAGTVDTDTGPRLRAGWTWAPSVLDHIQVSGLNQLWFDALTGICAHVHTGGGGLTPSDIAPARLTQPQIDELAHRYRVADILPLTPLQHGLLFVTDTARDNPDRVYAVQVEATLAGPIDLPRLRDAVGSAVARHPNLAARFCADYEQPVQVILADPDVPWSYFEADDEIAQVRAAERAAVYDLAEQSPLRVAVIRTAPDQHQLVLTTHHIALDGWSLPLLLGEVFAAYYGQRLAPAVPYRRFLTWLADRDADAARAAWAEVFAGFAAPTLVAPPNQLAMGPRDVTVVAVPARTTDALGELARAHQTTVSTVLHAAWAQLLMWLTGHRDLAFGAVVSGRPADLPGADAVVGLLINTVPVRATIGPSTTTVDVLEQLRAATAQTLEHQHLGLAEIHRATGHRGLFDTVVVYENYPADPAALTGADGLAITTLTTRDYYHYPLTVQAVPGPELSLHIQYRADVFDPAAIAALTERFQQILAAMTADPMRPIPPVDAPGRPAIALPEPGRRALSDGDRAPATPVEHTLAGIYAQVLGVDSVGVDDSFFDLGGDSLSAMRAIAAINAALGSDLAVSALFDAPSVLALSERLGRATS